MSHPSLDPESLRQIERALAGLKFGGVEITVHDGQITLIERREKIRPRSSSSGDKSSGSSNSEIGGSPKSGARSDEARS